MINVNRIFIIIFMILIGCAGQVIERTDSGRTNFKDNSHIFNGIKKKVAVLPFFNEAPVGGVDLGLTASSEMVSELARSKSMIVETNSTNLLGSSKEIYSGGGLKLIQLARKAKNYGINLVIFGRVIDARIRQKSDEVGLIRETKSYTESRIEVRVFDVNSNKEIYSSILKGFADDSNFKFFARNNNDISSDAVDQNNTHIYRRELIRYVVRVAVRRGIPSIVAITKRLDWVGRVAKIIGTKIYINAGRKSGMNIGDILKVITEVQNIYDPETGALIGSSKGEVKGTIEIIDYFSDDGSIAILHSGGSVQENDFVQLY